MPIIQSCCCWRSLRRGCYASAIYTMVYFSVTIVTMGHFIDMEQRYLTGDATEPTSESFLEPEKITPRFGDVDNEAAPCVETRPVRRKRSKKNHQNVLERNSTETKENLMKYLILAGHQIFAASMGGGYGVGDCCGSHQFDLLILLANSGKQADGTPEALQVRYCPFGYQEFEDSWGFREWGKGGGLNFNPITSFLFTLDFFIIVLNIYAMVCVISQFQEYLDGRGTAAFENVDRNTVQYTATAQQTTTTSSAPSGRRRSAARPMPSRCDPEEFSEAPTKIITPRQISDEYTEPRPQTSQSTLPSVLSRPSRSAVKKHVQFPDEQSCIEEAIEAPQPGPNEKPGETIFPMCPCSCHIFPRGTRHLLFVDGIGVGSSGARALTPAERAVLPASFPSSKRASENVRSRSTARRRLPEGFPLN
ncbi:unnamed protein product [Spodoptera littoralis]|uniref:Uncharacterized protein n=1 Tax=Spodoptera littoralis TaxID=7109 RepID=A0A9P0IKP2_SPOLI|nr:unnamed protein product [Spodoptera littoralis]CAH1647524.1 unnamed protein product [Spodoptera littoralis]